MAANQRGCLAIVVASSAATGMDQAEGKACCKSLLGLPKARGRDPLFPPCSLQAVFWASCPTASLRERLLLPYVCLAVPHQILTGSTFQEDPLTICCLPIPWQGTACHACGKDYFDPQRLLKHLRHAKRCRSVLITEGRAECSQPARQHRYVG